MEAGLVMQMISIHAPLTGSDPPVCAIWERLLISIHAPLTGSDSGGHNGHYGRVDFNPRSPHRERLLSWLQSRATLQFQSTLPSQGATRHLPNQIRLRMYFNPRSPHRERLRRRVSRLRCDSDFNPRSPHRERQLSAQVMKENNYISIHAPLTGSDNKRC